MNVPILNSHLLRVRLYMFLDEKYKLDGSIQAFVAGKVPSVKAQEAS